MSRNPKLSDLQLILLSTASQREDGSLFPLAESIGDQGDRIQKAIPPLLRRALVEKLSVSDRTKVWREEEDQRFGLVITGTGRALIAAEEGENADGQGPAPSEPSVNKPAPAPRVSSKAGAVLNLLRRAEGATIADLTDATGWLPHTTRAALTGLRKKGHAIEKSKRDDVTCYRIGEAA